MGPGKGERQIQKRGWEDITVQGEGVGSACSPPTSRRGERSRGLR